MTKRCAICGSIIQDGELVLAGIVTRYHEIPSRVAFALETPSKFVYVNHAACEEIAEDDGSED